MKLPPIATVVAALAIATAAVAQQPKPPANKADCEKAKMRLHGGRKGHTEEVVPVH